MEFTCPECGALNDLPEAGGDCDICGTAIVGEEPVLGKVVLKKVRRRRSQVNRAADLGATITPLGELGGRSLDSAPPPQSLFDDAPAPPPPPAPPGEMPPASVEDLFGALGGELNSPTPAPLPTAVDQPIGLDALVTPLGGGGAEPAAFKFGEPAPAASMDDLFGSLNATADEIAGEPPTRVVDIESNMPVAAMGSPDGWKVRSERGVVYELMTVDAVIAWLDGKTDLSGVRVAKGNGPFEEVVSFSEIAARLPQLSGGGRPPPNKPTVDSEELSLDIDPDRAAQQRERAQRAQRPPAERQPELNQRPSGSRRRDAPPRETVQRPDNPLGFGLVMWSLIAAGVLASVGVFVGLKLDWFTAPTVEQTASLSQAAPSDQLEAAIELYDDGKFAAAQARLTALAKTETDPRVHRYLALTYYRANRQPEARAALEEYRRGMLKQSGEHGRQVREVRD